MFEKIVEKALGVTESVVAKALLGNLKNVGKDLLQKKVVDAVGRALVKGIDEVVEAAVKSVPTESVLRVGRVYLDTIDEELVELQQDLANYIPHQVKVELMKKQHGKNSPEANAARAEREAFIAEVREEVRDVFAALTGDATAD